MIYILPMNNYKYKAKCDYPRDHAMQKAERYPYGEFIKEYGDNDTLLAMVWG